MAYCLKAFTKYIFLFSSSFNQISIRQSIDGGDSRQQFIASNLSTFFGCERAFMSSKVISQWGVLLWVGGRKNISVQTIYLSTESIIHYFFSFEKLINLVYPLVVLPLTFCRSFFVQVELILESFLKRSGGLLSSSNTRTRLNSGMSLKSFFFNLLILAHLVKF